MFFSGSNWGAVSGRKATAVKAISLTLLTRLILALISIAWLRWYLLSFSTGKWILSPCMLCCLEGSHCTIHPEGVQTQALSPHGQLVTWLICPSRWGSSLVLFILSCTAFEFLQLWLKTLWPNLTWGGKDLFYFIAHSPSPKEAMLGTWRQELV